MDVSRAPAPSLRRLSARNDDVEIVSGPLTGPALPGRVALPVSRSADDQQIQVAVFPQLRASPGSEQDDLIRIHPVDDHCDRGIQPFCARSAARPGTLAHLRLPVTYSTSTGAAHRAFEAAVDWPRAGSPPPVTATACGASPSFPMRGRLRAQCGVGPRQAGTRLARRSAGNYRRRWNQRGVSRRVGAQCSAPDGQRYG